MSRRIAGVLLSAGLCLLSRPASAGPVELLDSISFDPADPNHLVLSYQYGGHGMFVSDDAGKKLKWLCSTAVHSLASMRKGVIQIGGGGEIYMGVFDGLLKGDKTACGFTPVPELDKQFIAAISADPIDPKRTYVVTTTANTENGIFMNDGSGKFSPLGTKVAKFLDTLHVLKVGDKRRFYETGVLTDAMTNMVEYSVRVSDDEGTTWTDEKVDLAMFPPMDMYTDFSILDVDPNNPDHVLGRVSRRSAEDSVIFSDAKGKPGSWKVVATVTEVGGATFAPDGAIYVGDSDQKTKGLVVVPKPGEMQKKLNETMRISCLRYDYANKRLLGCSNNYHFGTIDVATGMLKPLLDLRCAEHAVECEAWGTGPSPMCMPPVSEYCRVDHWPIAPVCIGYDRGSDCATYASMQGFACVDGFAVSKETPDMMVEGAAGTCATVPAVGSSQGAAGMSMASASSGGAAGMSSSAPAASTGGSKSSATAGSGGATGGSNSAPEPEESSAGGCSCVVAGSSSEGAGLSQLGLALAGLGLVVARRRRKAPRA